MTLPGQLWAILTPSQRRWVLAGQAVSLFMALFTVAGVAAISPFFAVLGDPGVVEHNPLLRHLYVALGFQDTHAFVTFLGLGSVALVVLGNLVNLLGSYALLRLALWIGDDWRRTLFREYLHRDLLFHARTNSSTLYNNLTVETARVVYGMLQQFLVLVTTLLTIAFILLGILFVDPIGASGVIGGLAAGYLLVYATVRRRIKRAGAVEGKLSAQRTQLVLEALGGIKEIMVLRRQSYFQHRFERASTALSRLAAQIETVTSSPRHIMECVAVAGLVGYALVLSHSDAGIGQALAKLTFLGFAAYRLLPAVQQAFAATVRIRSSRPAFEAISGDLLSARAKGGEPVPVDPAWQARPEREISLSHVNFRYAADGPAALQDVSLRIRAGSVVGLVGSNGSGKTTLVDVLAGLLVPVSGQVVIDGIALDAASRPSWQSRIAYVPQSIFLLDASLSENIALGTASEHIDRERMLRAARLARLDEFVATLGQGYDERIGERGIRLSGGQRQRIGIARALYTDAAVLIMDEATNALDIFAEEEIMGAIEALRGKRTIILIAHRLNTLRQCDVILELEAGALSRSKRFAASVPNGPVAADSPASA